MEEWREFGPGYYEVSNRGGIRRKAPGVNTGEGRLKKPSLSSNGYMIVGCYVEGKRTNILVHRAVAEAFISPCPDGCQVNHKDGVKTNNSLSNLEYVTVSENGKHAIMMGLASAPTKRLYGEDHWTRKKPHLTAKGDDNGSRKHPDRLKRGESQHNSKLTEDHVRAIRTLAANGTRHCKIAKLFNVTQANIRYIVRGDSWKHVK